MATWQIQALDGDGNLLGYVASFTRLRVQLRGRKGGTWELIAAAESGADKFTEGTRMRARRGGITVTGQALKVTREVNSKGRTVTVSGITDVGLLAHRITLPSPERAFTAQDQVAYWEESGPAGFLIHRLVCRNAGMGAQGPRQQWDSRVGTSVRGNPQKGGAGWTDTSDGGVTWAGQVATIPSASSARLRMTDAIDLSTTDMATAVANVTVNGSCTLAISAYFNTTAAGAAPGQSGVVTETSVIHRANDIGSAVTLWLADTYRTRNAGKTWVRLEVGVQASGATRTATFNAGGGVWTDPLVGGTARVSTRYANLAETVTELANQGAVYLSADAPDGMPRLLVSTGVDRSASVKLSTSLGNVTSHSQTYAAPKGNVVLVAGSGEGTARVLRTDFDSASQSEWGLRIEGFRDARDTSDTATLDARADEWLTENAATAGLRVEAADVPGMTFGTDYDLGDAVSVVLGGAPITERVTSVEIVADSGETKVSPVIGSAELGEDAPSIYQLVRDLRRRISQLERRF